MKELEDEINGLKRSRTDTLALVPSNWKEIRNKYLKLSKKERQLRIKYRRTVDDAYDIVPKLTKLISAVDELKASKAYINTLFDVVKLEAPDIAMLKIKNVEGLVGSISGGHKIKSRLSKARRALRGKKLDRKKALSFLAS